MANSDEWVKAPGNPAADGWVTRTGCRTVLVVVPHMTAGTRLADLVPLVEADHRVQVLFTVPSVTDGWPEVEQYVRGWGGVVVPWHQVLRSRFDLAMAASYCEIDKICAPVMVVPHGIGGGRSRHSPWTTSRDAGPVQVRDVLVRDGRVVPAVVVVAHEADARALSEGCPEAAGRIVVAGDPCLDRIEASRPFRALYRRALRVGERQKLVMLSSTWSRYSLFGGDLDVWARLLAELPADRYRVVAALHPNVWAIHGRRQVLAWLADHLQAGLGVVPPEEGWRATLVSADHLIGDHGSVTAYGAALGVPVLLNTASADDVPAGSLAAHLRQTCAMVNPAQPWEQQLRWRASTWQSDRCDAVAQRITSCPGRSAAILRTTMYRLLKLSEPARGLPVSPVPFPVLLHKPGNERPSYGDHLATAP